MDDLRTDVIGTRSMTLPILYFMVLPVKISIKCCISVAEIVLS